MSGLLQHHPAIVVAIESVCAVVCLIVAVLVIVALDFDLDPHDDALYPYVRPGDFPRHVIIHFGPPRPIDWATDPDYSHLHDQEETQL